MMSSEAQLSTNWTLGDILWNVSLSLSLSDDMRVIIHGAV